MKQKMKPIFKIFILSFFITLFTGCSEDVYEENLSQSKRDYYFKKITFLELKSINNKAFIESSKLKKVLPPAKNNVINSISNFDIDLQNIQYLKKNNNHETFSFRILQVPDAKFTQNIIIDCKPNATLETYLITYYLDKPISQINNDDDFINSVTSTQTTRIESTGNGNTTNSCVEVGYYEEVDACEGELVTPGANPNCFNRDGSRRTVRVFRVIASACSGGGGGITDFNPLISQWGNNYSGGNSSDPNSIGGLGDGGETNSLNIFIPNFYTGYDLNDPAVQSMIQVNQFIYNLYSSNTEIRNVVESTEWLLAYTNYWLGVNGGLTPENQNALTYAFTNFPSVYYQHYVNEYTPTQISQFHFNAFELLLKHGEWLSNQDTQTQQNILQNINSIENIAFVQELTDLAVIETNQEDANKIISLSIMFETSEDIFSEEFGQSLLPFTEINPSQIPPDYPLANLSISTFLKYKQLRQLNPDWSRAKCLWYATKEMVHIGLDVFGMVPLFGEPADILNGVLYTIEGDKLNATLSYAGAVPLTGWAATGVKYAIKINEVATIGTKIKLVWKVGASGVIQFGSRNQLRKVLGITASNIQAHHIIPWAKQTHPAIQKAAKSGNAFHMNEALNGIPLSTAVHNGSHAHYDNLVQIRLNAIPTNATPQQAYNQIVDLINDIRIAIANNPNTPINQLNF